MTLRRALLLPTLLAVTLFLAAAEIRAAAAEPAALQAVAVSGVVSTGDGTPIAGATVTIGEQQFVADDQGHWDGAVPFAPRLREFVTAPGYVDDGYRELLIPSPNAVGAKLQDRMRSIFDADAESYARLPSTPPTVADFTTNNGVSRSQEVPADTSTITVTGTVGERDGEPVVRGDGYLAHPDDFVDQIAVKIQGDQFSAVFPITHGVGVYRVEINDSIGAAVINVPVFVGVPFKAEAPNWPDEADLADDGPVSRALEALQRVRQAHGLAAYVVDARLGQVAQDHVDDMLAHNWICHCWADGSGLLDHVRAAGVNPAQVPVPGHPNQFTLGVGNGISTAPGAAAIRGLFASPGHRSDLLGAYTHVGIAYGGQVGDGTSRLSIVYAIEH
jgi:uncharacterized protein YkwD